MKTKYLENIIIAVSALCFIGSDISCHSKGGGSSNGSNGSNGSDGYESESSNQDGNTADNGSTSDTTVKAPFGVSNKTVTIGSRKIYLGANGRASLVDDVFVGEYVYRTDNDKFNLNNASLEIRLVYKGSKMVQEYYYFGVLTFETKNKAAYAYDWRETRQDNLAIVGWTTPKTKSGTSAQYVTFD